MNHQEIRWRRLMRAFRRARSSVPFLGRAFGTDSVETWRQWSTLPLTTNESYRRLAPDQYFAKDTEMYAPIAPFDLGAPQFPLNALVSTPEMDMLTDRVEHIVDALEICERESVAVVADPAQRYAASDLVDHLAQLKVPTQLVISSSSALPTLSPSVVFWMSARKPPSDVRRRSRIVSFNRGESSRNEPDVIHLDHVPYFALATDEASYKWVEEQFHVERGDENELVITTLYESMLPLVRYATGLRVAQVEHGSFTLALQV